MKFETNLISLIKPFRCIKEKSRQKLNYLQNEKRLLGEIKFIFHHLRPDSAPLINLQLQKYG